MATPTREALQQWLDNYGPLWNAGKKDEWLANWRRVCSGQVTMEDPVGTRVKRGEQECFLAPWELWNGNTKFVIRDAIICANEVAFANDNHVTYEGKKVVTVSIETYRFEPDGSVVIRTYWHVPSTSKIAAEYLA
jgi:hypothetical protein